MTLIRTVPLTGGFFPSDAVNFARYVPFRAVIFPDTVPVRLWLSLNFSDAAGCEAPSAHRKRTGSGRSP